MTNLSNFGPLNEFIAEITNDFSATHPQSAGKTLAANYIDRYAQTEPEPEDESDQAWVAFTKVCHAKAGKHILDMADQLVDAVRLGVFTPNMGVARVAKVLQFAISAEFFMLDRGQLLADQLGAVHSLMTDYVSGVQSKLG